MQVLNLQTTSCAHYSTKPKQGKIYNDINEALKDIQDGSKLLVGGFGLCGIPENLIKALNHKSISGLTVVSNNAGKIHYFSSDDNTIQSFKSQYTYNQEDCIRDFKSTIILLFSSMSLFKYRIVKMLGKIL